MGTKKVKKLSESQVEKQVGSYQEVNPEAVLKAGREAGEKERAKNKAAEQADENPVK